ncbi:MAG TPA: MaoC family dehydratase [Pseudonocardiaceae bacterium]|nr:MaoC family dehydratase [Pseudonocardiaceae bacterium]
MSAPTFAGVSVGDELPPLTVTLTRADLVRYAGASLDFNPIHWNQRVATAVGLPDVIAHGMLTMALAGRLVTDWVGDPGAVVDFKTKFTRPVVVPDDEDGATVELTGKVGEKREDGTVRVDITAKFNGQTVLGRPVAVVRLAE